MKYTGELPLVALIMAGGRGERFWPKSRFSRPKQFLNILGEKSMLQMTVERIGELVPPERVFIATGADYYNLTREQLPMLPIENVIVEPVGRDTAPCIGLATLYIERRYPESVILVLPADHLILNGGVYLDCLSAAANAALEEEAIVTLGIKPDRPETGYGYIHVGDLSSKGIYKAKGFKEKPDRDRAENYLATGEYLWNSGMFIWRLDTIKKLIARYMPEIHKRLDCIRKSIGTTREKEVLEKEFSCMPKISIDYGVLEKAEKVYVIPGNFGWDDVGGWPALTRLLKTDYRGNLLNCRHVGIDTSNCVIEGNGKLVATIGVKDIIVVATDDVILVCSKERTDDLKNIMKILKDKNMEEYL